MSATETKKQKKERLDEREDHLDILKENKPKYQQQELDAEALTKQVEQECEILKRELAQEGR